MSKIKKSSILINVFLLFGTLIAAFPFIWMILSSFKTSAEILRVPATFFPEHLYFGGFVTVMTEAPFFRWLLNSLIVAVIVTVIVVFTSSIGGYIFSKFNFKGKNIIFVAILATMMVPFEVMMLPEYIIVSKMKLLNNLASLIIPFMVSSFGIFLAKQFIDSIPNDLIESGRIDGASELKIYFSIIVPEIKPALSALAIFTFMGSWNNYLWPLITINDNLKRTVPLALTYFRLGKVAQVNLVMDAAALIIIPVIIVYLIFQKQFVEGLTLTGIK